MSEKRFVCIDVGYGDDWYITDNGKRLSEMEIVDMLNELNDENEQLRKRNKFLEEFDGRAETFANLKEANEHLRQSVEYWQKKYEEGTETFQINENDIGGMLNE